MSSEGRQPVAARIQETAVEIAEDVHQLESKGTLPSLFGGARGGMISPGPGTTSRDMTLVPKAVGKTPVTAPFHPRQPSEWVGGLGGSISVL